MKLGYARVSSVEQNLDLQKDALLAAGCEKVITDKASGSVTARSGLEKVREQLHAGDTLVVWRLDCSRPIAARLDRLDDIPRRPKGRPPQPSRAIDRATTSGKLTFHLFGALAQFERNLIRERTQAGLAAARSRGKKGGRPTTLNEDKRDQAVKLYHENTMSVAKICSMLGISKPTLYAYVRSAETKSAAA